MLFTILDLNDVFHQNAEKIECCRSSNPYDYIRTGYYIDNAALFGGYNNVDFKCNNSSDFAKHSLGVTYK